MLDRFIIVCTLLGYIGKLDHYYGIGNASFGLFKYGNIRNGSNRHNNP